MQGRAHKTLKGLIYQQRCSSPFVRRARAHLMACRVCASFSEGAWPGVVHVACPHHVVSDAKYVARRMQHSWSSSTAILLVPPPPLSLLLSSWSSHAFWASLLLALALPASLLLFLVAPPRTSCFMYGVRNNVMRAAALFGSPRASVFLRRGF